MAPHGTGAGELAMFDLIIRGGQVLDGTGAASRRLDVGVRDGVVAALETSLDGEAAEVIDATDRVVTPGFVDVHGHYDGQATWDELLEPSTPHGVTTLIMGNCGVGFAPARPTDHHELIELMDGVEDIPGAALSEGISWGWESYPEYLDVLDGRRWSVDLGTQLPHGLLRSYVMGTGRAGDAATADDLDQMVRLTREAIEAGAFGFTTSRTLGHKSLDGRPVPGTYAQSEELLALGHAVVAGGGGVFEVAGSGLAPADDPAMTAAELDWMGRLAGDTGLTTTFILLQCDDAPDRWRDEMARAAEWRRRGHRVVPLVAGRPFGIIWNWEVRHPFSFRNSYRAVAHLPLPERLEVLGRPEVRAAILAEPDVYRALGEERHGERFARTLPRCFAMVGTPDYEQPPSATLGAKAQARGQTVWEVAYDELLGGAALLLPLYNYSHGDHAALWEQLQDPDAVLGLDDGGAHYASICDASIPTYLLTHWVRDRTRGPRLELADAVRRLTSQPADLYGLTDRGRIELGKRADLNVIDTAGLSLGMPRAVADLPAGGTRLLQDATGYDATIVAGTVTRRSGVDTGARPGRLLRR